MANYKLVAVNGVKLTKDSLNDKAVLEIDPTSQVYQNLKGVQGATGVQGVIGPQGAGLIGPTGPTGDVGAVGSQGKTGPQGFNGNDAYTTLFTNFFQVGVGSTVAIMVVDSTSYGINEVVAINNTETANLNYFQIEDITSSTDIVLKNLGYPTNDSPGTQIIATGTILFKTGYMGPDGYQGNIGPKGDIGSQGFTGLQGSVGAKGDTGSQGSVGVQGNIGVQGFVGVQGMDGAKGVQGFTGVQGNIGNTGIQGKDGVQGFTGSTGNTGVQGLTGNDGVQGFTGAQGSIGADSTVPGPQGPQGVIGPQGQPNGPQGPTGPQGSSSIVTYQAYSVPGHAVWVTATGTGVTYSIDTSGATAIGTFSIPSNVRLLGCVIKLFDGYPTGFDTANGYILDYSDLGVSGINQGVYNRYPPIIQGWREDSGAILALSIIVVTTDFSQTKIVNLNATAINTIRYTFV